jgi:hypothetical protein
MSAQPPYPPPPSRPPSYRPGRRPFPIAAVLAAVVVLIVVAGVAYWLGGRNDNKPSASATTPPASTAASASGGAVASATTAVAPSASNAVAATASDGVLEPSPSAAAAPSSAPSPTVTSPSPTPATTTSPPANPVPDFGYLHSVVSASGVTKITFDRAILLTGPAAASYGKAHHLEVTDDYIIQNDNPLIRTWTLSPTAVVLGSIQLNNTVAQTPSTVAALQTFVAAHPKSFLPVDLYYDKNDAVTKIAEVYFP